MNSSSRTVKYQKTPNGLEEKQREAPWDRANLLAKYALCFVVAFFRKGSKLNLEDIGAPPRANYSKVLGPRLLRNYNAPGRPPNFARALFRTFGPQLMVVASLELLGKCAFLPMQSVCLGWIIRESSAYLVLVQSGANATLQDLQEPGALAASYWRIAYSAMLMVMFICLGSLFSHPLYFQGTNIGAKCRIAASHLIYKKSLRLNQRALAKTNVGQMVNLLTNDLNRFDQLITSMTYIVIAPLQALTVIVILSTSYLGLYPTLASVAAIVLYVAVQALMGRGFIKARAKTAPRTDERVRLMNEIILAMRIIKMYAWEEPFKRLVYAARKREITRIALTCSLKVINMTLFFVSSKIIVFVALVTFVMLGEGGAAALTPEILFVTIGLANYVRVSLTLFFPNAVGQLAETLISCRRINQFLQLPELDATTGARYEATDDGRGHEHALAMSQVCCSWASAAESAERAIVRDLTLAVRPRELLMVVGRVGSGKSSVLMAILGELPVASGRLEVHGRVAYAAQEAWIFSGTVRANILFGKPMDAARYREVVRVCALDRDLELLAEADQTIVGERGVSLSGGQKARVNLARALYAEADVYILDDPLSAVDAPVAKQIFNQSLRKFLRDKTLIEAASSD